MKLQDQYVQLYGTVFMVSSVFPDSIQTCITIYLLRILSRDVTHKVNIYTWYATRGDQIRHSNMHAIYNHCCLVLS